LRPAQWIGGEITIAAAALAPTAHPVSKKWAMIDTSLGTKRFATQALDFDFSSFLLIFALLI
jgi:hypothetical protein